MSDVTAVLATVELAPGMDAGHLDELRVLFSWLPLEYLDCLQWSDGLEGHVGGGGYLRLWSARSALHFNSAYNVPEFLPSVFLFGTDAAALGYGFDRRNPGRVLSVELAALDDEYLTDVAASFNEFVLGLTKLGASDEPLDDHHPPAWLRGHVLHEKHPVVLGGRADDPANRVLVPEADHPALAVFFARTLRAVRSRTMAGQ